MSSFFTFEYNSRCWLLLFRSHGWKRGPMEEYGNIAMKDFTPHVVLEIYTFLKQTLLEGKYILDFLKGLQQCFNFSQALLPFAYFLFWRELGKDFQELICKNRLCLLHFSISSSSCSVIWAQFWALPQICSVTWGKVACSLSSSVFQS